MLILLSPAKTLDFITAMPEVDAKAPRFLEQAGRLVRRMRQFDAAALAELMSISPALADLNVERYRRYAVRPTPERARPALFAFAGDVYDGLDAYRLTQAQLAQAEQRVRILSGLYGLLRPFDLIQPYRLEMGTRLDTGAPRHLYRYWSQLVTTELNHDLADDPHRAVINLASAEYFGVVDQRLLDAEVIHPVFEDYSAGRYKIVSFFAKHARGRMARFALQRRIKAPAALKHFDCDGYTFHDGASDATRWVFRRHLKGS